MAESFVQAPTDGTGKKKRTYDKGTPGHDPYVIPTTERIVAGVYQAASFRYPGTTATQVQATIQNTAGAAKLIAIRYLAIDVSKSTTAGLLTFPMFSYYHLTGVTPTGGTLAVKAKLDSAYVASQANTEIRFGASADGTATTPVHALPAGSPARRSAHPHMLTGAGQYLRIEQILQNWRDPPLILRATETGLLNREAAATTTTHAVVKIAWEEFTE